MTAMTFESINASPRRAAVKRSRSSAPQIVNAIEPVVALPLSGDARKSRNTLLWIATFGVICIAHWGAYDIFHRPAQITVLPRKISQLAIDIAPPPPPPPPPVIQPKIVPRVVAAKPAPRPLPPSVPVVQNVAQSDTPAPDAVQVAPPQPAPAPVASPPPPAPEVVTEARAEIGSLRNPFPDYPSAAQLRKIQGRVVLRVHVLANGKAGEIEIDKSSGYDILDQAAIKTIKERWEFQPAMRGKTPIEGTVTQSVNFKL